MNAAPTERRDETKIANSTLKRNERLYKTSHSRPSQSSIQRQNPANNFPPFDLFVFPTAAPSQLGGRRENMATAEAEARAGSEAGVARTTGPKRRVPRSRKRPGRPRGLLAVQRRALERPNGASRAAERGSDTKEGKRVESAATPVPALSCSSPVRGTDQWEASTGGMLPVNMCGPPTTAASDWPALHTPPRDPNRFPFSLPGRGLGARVGGKGGGRSIQNNDARVEEEEREEGRKKKKKGGEAGPAGGKEKKGGSLLT